MINIFEIQQKVQEAIDEAFEKANSTSKEGFIAFLAEGDYVELLKQSGKTPFVVDFKGDIPFDVKRHEFMCRYLNKHYTENGFDYSGENEIDEMLIEMMIYTHLWESYYLLKHLVRLAQLSIGNSYPWKVEIPDGSKRDFLCNNVINPTKKKKLMLGTLVEDSYSSYLRNSFAHSRFVIYEKTKEIYYGCNTGKKVNKRRISFDDFQRKFYQSAFMSYYLYRQLGEYKKDLMKQVGCESVPIIVRDEIITERKIYIKVEKHPIIDDVTLLKARIE